METREDHYPKVCYEVEQVIETQVNDILLWVVVTGMEKEQMKRYYSLNIRKMSISP